MKSYIKLAATGAVLSGFFLAAPFSHAQFSLFSDDFDTYTNGAINGQGNWVDKNGATSGVSAFDVADCPSGGGGKCADWDGALNGNSNATSSPPAHYGAFSFRIRVDDPPANETHAILGLIYNNAATFDASGGGTGPSSGLIAFEDGTTGWAVTAKTAGSATNSFIFDNLSLSTWYTVNIQWSMNSAVDGCTWILSIPSSGQPAQEIGWVNWVGEQSEAQCTRDFDAGGYEGIGFYAANAVSQIWLDEVGSFVTSQFEDFGFDPATTTLPFTPAQADEYCGEVGSVFDLGTGACRAGVFLFIPSTASVNDFVTVKDEMLNNRFPFSWITDMREILNDITATTTENFINVTLDFGTTTEVLGFSDWEVISTSTISTYLSDDTRNVMKTLLATVFYLLAAGFLYRSVQGFWHKQV